MSDCIDWWGTTDDKGYGVLRVRGRKAKAHRMVWEECFGLIPPETPFVLHHCDRPPCVNPEHLFLGTNADNMRDKMSKGRWRGGRPRTERCGNGHPWSEENTGWTTRRGRPYRYCRTCQRRRSLAQHHKSKIDIKPVKSK